MQLASVVVAVTCYSVTPAHFCRFYNDVTIITLVAIHGGEDRGPTPNPSLLQPAPPLSCPFSQININATLQSMNIINSHYKLILI